jgi:hypothetical protein
MVHACIGCGRINILMISNYVWTVVMDSLPSFLTHFSCVCVTACVCSKCGDVGEVQRHYQSAWAWRICAICNTITYKTDVRSNVATLVRGRRRV